MSIAENIAKIKAELAKANKQTQLIAVSKMHPQEAVREAYAAGQKLFGENRVQEAQEKFPQLQVEFKDLQLHLIGPLQTNKVKEALELFDVIQTVDREKLAVKFAESLNEKSRTKEFYIQVNTGEEEQKAGISPLEAVKFIEYCRNDLKLNITGLMCIPPVGEHAFMHFGLLRNIAMELLRANPQASASARRGNQAAPELMKLSMGMSGDYLQAADMGADYVRIGSAIFGAR